MTQLRNMTGLAALVLMTLVSCEMEEPRAGSLVPPTVDENPNLPYIEVNGTRLHARTFGNPSDPIIIMLHGGPGGDHRYLLNLKAFADDGYFTVFFDQRGAGLSRRHDQEIYAGDIYLEDLHRVIAHYRQHPGQQVFLMGHSWGAMYATWYVNEYPDQISGLILAEPGGFYEEQTNAYTGRAFAPEFFREWLNDATWRDQMITGEEHETMDYNYMLFMAGNVNTGDAEKTPVWRLGMACFNGMTTLNPGYDWTTRLDRYTTKVLFMYSELNQAYGEAHAREVASAYPHVEIHEIKGVGHEITYFAFDQFHELSLSYLNEFK